MDVGVTAGLVGSPSPARRREEICAGPTSHTTARGRRVECAFPGVRGGEGHGHRQRCPRLLAQWAQLSHLLVRFPAERPRVRAVEEGADGDVHRGPAAAAPRAQVPQQVAPGRRGALEAAPLSPEQQRPLTAGSDAGDSGDEGPGGDGA